MKDERKITVGMSDEERAEILRGKVIENIPTVKPIQSESQCFEIEKWEDINSYLGKEKRTIIQKIATSFDVFKCYENSNVNITFNFSANNFRESYSKQGSRYELFAKMFSVFDDIISNAVLIEVHNRDNYKPDSTLRKLCVLASAFIDNNSIIPVKLEIKEFYDKPNTLYVAIALNKIKMTEVWKQGITQRGVAQNSRSVNISIADLAKKINPSDKSFLKYFPDQMLNEVQLLSKQIALLEDLKRAKMLQEKQGEKMKRPQNFDELLDIAKKRPDVHGALSQLGVSLKRVGHSMGGVRWQTETKSGTSGDLSAIAFIEKDDGSWVICDNKGRTGQQFIDSITLLREIFGVSFDDAVYMLSGGAPSAPVAKPKKLTLERKAEPREERTYTPPTPAPDKLRNVKAYLIQTRKLPKELILTLIDSGKIYASERFKNKIAFCTFPITDENGNNVGTDMAGTIDNMEKEYRKHMIPGSNADYAWCFPYEVEEITSETPIFFCEAPIDTMSLCALSGTPGIYVSMAGCKDRTFTSVTEKLGGTPIICVDNDETGDAFAARHPDVARMVAPIGKDWNDTLKYYVENNMSYAFAPPDAAAAIDVTHQDNVAHVHYESEDVDPKKENGALDKGASIQDKAITMDMPEEERAEILRNKTITPCNIEIHEDFNIDWESLENNRLDIIKTPLLHKLRELGFLKQYNTSSINIEFSFTRKGLKKSINSQAKDYGGSLADLSKVVMNMQNLLDSSVLIEVHSDKAKGTPKENEQLIQTYVLLSAYKEPGTITPVQFEIKQYIDSDNRLYLAVAMTKREEDVVNATIQDKSQASPRLLSPSTYSIAEFIEKINPKDENFFKYIPNSFLSEEQKQAKANALAREAKKYGRSLTEEKPDNPPLNDEAPIGAENVDKHSQDELRATLEGKVKNVVENYRADPRALADYVLFASRFNNYSANNLRLIWSQYPYAQYVTSAYDFSHGLPDKNGKPTVSEKIFIKKGERALRIWKPYDVKYTIMPDGTEKRSAWLTKSERELAKAENWKTLTRQYFTLVPVFDITQTTASPDVYPKLCGFGGTKGTSADARFNALKNYCENVLNCPVKVRDFGERKATVRGSYYPDLNEIHISDMLEGENKLSTFIHELGHATLHADSYKNASKSTAQIELEADMYALMIERRLGIEPTDARCRHLKAHYDEYIAEIKSNDINADTELFNSVIDRYREQIPLIDAYVDNLNVADAQTVVHQDEQVQSNDIKLSASFKM